MTVEQRLDQLERRNKRLTAALMVMAATHWPVELRR